MEAKIKQLEMIQGIVNRMASNSFVLKGWAVTLVAGVFALANKDTDRMYFIVAYIPIIIFWGLDAYYLLQERLFRSLYNKTKLCAENEIDFNMNILKNEFRSKKNTWAYCVISATELGFYFPLAIISAGVNILVFL